MHQTSSFTAEPDEPATRVLCTVEREEPTLSGRVGRETEGNSTGEKSGQAGLASAHRQTGRGSPRRSQSARVQKRGSPQLAQAAPHHALRSCGARARAGHTHPTPVRGSAAVPARKTPGRGAYVPSNTHSTSRATYGSRVLSNMVSGRTAT